MRASYMLFFLLGFSFAAQASYCYRHTAKHMGNAPDQYSSKKDVQSLRRILMHADSTLRDVRIICCKTDPKHGNALHSIGERRR